jgi:transposase
VAIGEIGDFPYLEAAVMGTHIGGDWTLETVRVGPSRCPGCGRPSTSVHGTYHRRIQDLPMQAGRVILNARIRQFRSESAP